MEVARDAAQFTRPTRFPDQESAAAWCEALLGHGSELIVDAALLGLSRSSLGAQDLREFVRGADWVLRESSDHFAPDRLVALARQIFRAVDRLCETEGNPDVPTAIYEVYTSINCRLARQHHNDGILEVSAFLAASRFFGGKGVAPAREGGL